MKRITGMLAAAVIVAFVAAGCGGSSSDSGTTTPPATSSRTTTAMANASQWMSDTTVLIQTALGGGGASASVKTVSGNSISCTGTYGGFSCTIWDDLGSISSADHKCDVTGTYNTTLYSFDLEYDCYTFEPDTDVMVDGKWTASISFNGAASSTSASKDFTVEKATSDNCDVEEINNICGQTYTFEGGSCTATCDVTASCTQASAIAMIEWTVLERAGSSVNPPHLTMTDACGTYIVEAGTTATMAFCMPSNTQFVMSSTMNGTINGTAVDQNFDIDCTYTY